MIIGISLVILIFSIMLHEITHGAVAYLCGDDTAQKAGRLTLNPLKHIDPVGSILLPVLLMLSQMQVLFGWAKPVPINPNRMRHPKRDMVWASLAAPLVNILLIGIGFLGIKWIIGQVGSDLFHTYLGLSQEVKNHILLKSQPGMFYVMLECCLQLIFINVALAFFNLIPIPPLDGSRILLLFLPPQWEEGYYWLEKYGILLLFVLLYFNVFSPFFDTIFSFISQLIWTL